MIGRRIAFVVFWVFSMGAYEGWAHADLDTASIVFGAVIALTSRWLE